MRASIVAWSVRCIVGLGLVPASAAAQGEGAAEMVFGADEVPPASVDAAPSQDLADALRLYQGEHYAEAAVRLMPVVDGTTHDAPRNVDRAQLTLAKCLYHLQLYRGALSLFDDISARGPSHAYFDAALPWLAMLGRVLEEPAGVAAMVGRYPDASVDALGSGADAAVVDHARYLAGRHAYDEADFTRAVERLSEISPRSPDRVRGLLLQGVTHVRARHAQPAIASFRAALDAIDHGAPHEGDLRGLAWLSLGRVYYTAANRVDDEGERTIDPVLLANAIAAFDRVETTSEHWPDALFERSWALFLVSQESRALGSIHALASPYFEGRYYPEAHVLRAVVYFGACQLENADAVVRDFHQRFDPVRDELARLLAAAESEDVDVRLDAVARLPGAAGGAQDPMLARHVAYLAQLDEERARFDALPDELRASAVGDYVLQELAVARAFATDALGSLAHARIERQLAELDELMSQMDAVEVETVRVTREGLSDVQRSEAERIRAAGGLEVEVDEEHQIWPFDGEYWRDELPSYRQRVSSICTR
ncbi:MAG: hypothetical protein AB7S26_01635 [Sandaracinaceae bacterium]